MNPFHLVPLLAVFALVTGCAGNKEDFTRIRATNYRDQVISEWTARGRVVPLERGGYRIMAVERRSGSPDVVETRYPDGWQTTVQGAHIWRWECAKPAWLAELEGDEIRTDGVELR